MQQITYNPNVAAELAILIKKTSFKPLQLENNYVTPLIIKGLKKEQIKLCSVQYQTIKKCSAAFAKEYLKNYLPNIAATGVKYLLVADPIYFKYLVKPNTKTGTYGIIYDCHYPGYEYLKVILAPNYQAILFNPALQAKLDLALTSIFAYMTTNTQILHQSIIHNASYPETPDDIEKALNSLLEKPILFCDIETRGLDFYNCGLSTIAFATDRHSGLAFAIDRGQHSRKVKVLLKRFYEAYTGRLIFHNATFDTKILIFELWMKNLGDYRGMIDGLNTICKHTEDTKLIAYLCLNNTIQTKLSLKELAYEYAGNYGEENIANTELIPLPELLTYNLKDSCCTAYVWDKYYPLMVQENQEDIYTELFRPAIKSIVQMELCGLPIDPDAVKQLKIYLQNTIQIQDDFFASNQIIQDFHYTQLEQKARQKTLTAAKKVYTTTDSVIVFDFNPNSDIQLQRLLYGFMEYTPIDFTKTKAPATGAKTIEKLINFARTPEHKEIFQKLINRALANKIITSFIPAFEKAQKLPDGSYRLYGNFGLGATKSGRMNSSNPNLQNLPSNSIYGKAVKKCFICPPGWLFTGADFDSLEDRINALVTKDPNKLKVYVDLYDGHCLRAFSYFGDQMPDIQLAENNERCFAVQINGLTRYIKCGTLVKCPKTGKSIKIEDYYDNLETYR